MRKILTALAVAATIATAAAAATPASADGGGGWWGPAAFGGFIAGAIVGNQIARPRYPGPVVYEYAQPGPTHYEYYALPPQYFAPEPPQPCGNWPGSYRARVC
jgi:hypothetical protein